MQRIICTPISNVNVRCVLFHYRPDEWWTLEVNFIHTHPDPLTGYVGFILHSTTVSCEYLWGYYKGTLMLLLLWASSSCRVPHSTLKDTLTCHSHSGTALYETHVVSHKEAECVFSDSDIAGKLLTLLSWKKIIGWHDFILYIDHWSTTFWATDHLPFSKQ